MAFTVTSISPIKAPYEGGSLLVVTGTFELTARYRVHIGDVATSADPTCYSGVPGQGDTVYATNATTLKVYTPRLIPSATPYHLLVIDIDTSLAQTLSSAFTADNKQFYSLVYGYRKVMHPDFKVGPRNIDLEAIPSAFLP